MCLFIEKNFIWVYILEIGDKVHVIERLLLNL